MAPENDSELHSEASGKIVNQAEKGLHSCHHCLSERLNVGLFKRYFYGQATYIIYD